MLSVASKSITLSVIMLSVIMLSVIMLSVVAPFVSHRTWWLVQASTVAVADALTSLM